MTSDDKIKAIGILGGTFDPPHNGHIQLGLEVKEHFELSKVIVSPANISPLKELSPVASAKQRLKMVRKAFSDIEGFEVVDDEIHNDSGSPSYTIDFVKALKKRHLDTPLFLILGEDLLKDFFKWKGVEELIELAPPLLGSRDGQFKDFHSVVPREYWEVFEANFCKIHNLEISSTYLRKRLSKKGYVGHLIPAKVVDYILEHGLYLASEN